MILAILQAIGLREVERIDARAGLRIASCIPTGFHNKVGRGGCFGEQSAFFVSYGVKSARAVRFCHRDRTTEPPPPSIDDSEPVAQKTTLQNRSGTPQTVRDDVRIVQKDRPAAGQQQGRRDDEQGQGGRDSHPRECAAGSMGRVLPGVMEAARAKPIREFSCS